MNAAELDRAANAVALADGPEADALAHSLIQECVRGGAYPAPVGRIYQAIGRGEVAPLTVPAFNLRGLTYDVARAFWRRAMDQDAVGMMFELAPAEARVAAQSFPQYAALVCAAARREGYEGPVFLQGDHFSLESSKATERDELVALAKTALGSGFRQIDLDTAALVVEGPDAETRQTPNAGATAGLLTALADHSPSGTIFGGEVGEIGGANTTPAELQAFIDLVRHHAGAAAPLFGKVSVQTGTRHGGMSDASGHTVRMPLDLDLAAELAAVARTNGFGGIVQHGASTLQLDQFQALPAAGIIEVHLATNIQNLVFDAPAFPPALRSAMRQEALASTVGAAERGAETQEVDAEQAFSNKRWSLWGPYKGQLLGLPEDVRQQLAEGVADWAAELLVAFRLAGRGAELRRLYRDMA